MTKHQIYIYRPVNKESEIRILQLQPAYDFNAPLVAIVQHYDLGDRTKYAEQDCEEDWVGYLRRQELAESQWTTYEAISYAWGSDTASATIEIYDPKSTTVMVMRPNVDTMLRHLRYEKKERRLWIDALCIN
jgi:hypothetical protein